jgi:hypothetical protein
MRNFIYPEIVPISRRLISIFGQLFFTNAFFLMMWTQWKKDSLTREDGRLLENGSKMAFARYPSGSRKGEIVNL